MDVRLGLHLSLEPLSWAPINGLKKSLRLIHMAGRPNVRIVIDYWHCFTAGVAPEEVAQLDKKLIYGVHVCDSLPFSGGIPIEDELVGDPRVAREGSRDSERLTRSRIVGERK